MLKSIFEAQIRLRNGLIRAIGRCISRVDQKIYSMTSGYELLELDLVVEISDGKNSLLSSWFRRLSFPHMAATVVVTFNVFFAVLLLPLSVGLANWFYYSSLVLYPVVFFASIQARPALLRYAMGPWVVNGVKCVGLSVAAFSLLMAAVALLFLAALVAFLWAVVAVLGVVFLPGVGWAAVSAEVEGLMSLFSSKKAPGPDGTPKP